MQDNGKYHKLNGEEVPEKLRQIDSAPRQLFFIGQNPNDILVQPSVAIVGSRKPTAYGREVTSQIASSLSRRGIVIISGLALGVDTIAHQACLDAGGITVAVLPCGPEMIYPASHRDIAKQIIQTGGTVLTEYPEGTPALRQHFIARNRLVSGMADVVIVTEAAEKSGTLHTANFALNQSKTVMAVPGPINSSMSRGTNNLIKSGALPLTSPDDVFFQLGISSSEKPAATAQNKEEQTILHLMQEGLRSGHELLQKSELPVATFQETLTMLEINGQIKPLGNNYWSLS